MAHCARLLPAALLLLAPAPLRADPPSLSTGAVEAPDCQLCNDPFGERAAVPLRIEVRSGLTFGRMALLSDADGRAEITPQNGGTKQEEGLMDLGGMAFQGEVIITGEPHRPIRVDMPADVRLRAPGGAEARLTDFTTDLPPVPRLDDNGVLKFGFGATLTTKDARGGDFRGRIPISVSYF